MRWMNQINLWGPVCETLFYWLQQTPEGFWSANSQPLAGLWLPQLDHLHLQPEACASERTWGSLPLTMARSPLRSWKPTSWWHCWHFLLLSQPAFRAVEKKKKSIQWDDIKSQQDKNFVAAIQSKMLPPARLWACHYDFKTLLCSTVKQLSTVQSLWLLKYRICELPLMIWVEEYKGGKRSSSI